MDVTVKRVDFQLDVRDCDVFFPSVLKKKCGGTPAYFRIVKKSLDARNKNRICWRYCVEYSMKPYSPPEKVYDKVFSDKKIAVIGSGPAGLFCSIRLVQHGIVPIIIERGEDVVKRRVSCQRFFDKHVLDVNSNVQFGEGGAGAFSDGKLNTQTKDSFNRDVLELFVRFGAPEDILYVNKPHVGSDNLYNVLKNIRSFLELAGVRYFFDTTFVGFTQRDGRINTILLRDRNSCVDSELPVDMAVLCPGHSARDTFEMLSSSGIYMEPKEFAVGARIEHLRDLIGKAQYGNMYKFLPAADYKLVSHSHERTVFTFCMCPGGFVIPASSEKEGLVVNGMSLYSRDAENSNSALMVQMKKEDFGGDDLFAGMRFQRSIERKAFSYVNDYSAPVQLYGDFKADRVSSSLGDVRPSCLSGYSFAPINEILPSVCVSALKAAIPDMGKKLKGFDSSDAVLSGVETRFSSPVKIVRNQNCESVSLKGLFPCGEGAGYSGGITSSAADGLNVAETIVNLLR